MTLDKVLIANYNLILLYKSTQFLSHFLEQYYELKADKLLFNS